MAEDVTLPTLAWGVEELRGDNVNAATTSSTTTLISVQDGRRFTDGSLTIYNRGQGGTATVKVWVNNNETPGTIATASQGWSQLGDNISLTSGSAANKQWTGRYRWVGITATVASGTGYIDVYLRAYS